jgi:predicted TIM-barrel fold metal-dependent hydrolase
VNPIPHSAGTGRPAFEVPALACDAHMHIYDRARGTGAGVLAQAGVAEYRALQARLGTTRTVIVTPRAHGTDNTPTLDGIARLGAERTRGVAVVDTSVTDAELEGLHAGGVRGIRFTLYTPENAPTSFAMVEPLAARVHALGWHVQLHWTAAQIVEHAAMLERLPTPMVFDHLARLPAADGPRHPAFEVVRRLIDRDRAWAKLSGAYLDSVVGEAGGYADVEAIARAWSEVAAERTVWGSDWPHPTERHKPDDARLMNLLLSWTDGAAGLRRVLVDNPARLYGF